MNIHEFINLIGKKKQTIFSVLAIFLAVAIIFSAVQPFKYDSNLELLTIITFKDTVDPYTASRSNQYLSDLLARIVSSGSFFEKVEASGFNIDKSYFSGSEKQQMKKWDKTVKAKSVADTGMISIDVYHTDRSQAEEIAKAVAYTLQTTNSQYHGYGDAVQIKIIDSPITSNYPVLPNIPLNLALAIVFSLVFSSCYIYLFPEEKYDLRLWPKKKEAGYAEIELNEPETEAETAFAPSAIAAESAETENYQPENVYSTNNYQPEDFQNSGSMDNILKR
jgi:capsular polysaccharide biosynthesis protein